MNYMLDGWSGKRFRLLNTTNTLLTGKALFPFAYEEIECRRIGKGLAMPLIHMWRHERAFIAGLRDRKLPQAEEALQWLQAQGFQTAVRHSGGAAVPLDGGVVNVTVILPKSEGKLDFKQDFQFMANMITEAVKPFSTEEAAVGEIVGSYCPGDYDISIRGTKFCGLAQRRHTRSFMLQAFVVVEGSGETRAQWAQQFYQRANPNAQEDSSSHPIVRSNTMRSLSEVSTISSTEEWTSTIKHLLSPMIVEETTAYDPELSLEADQLITNLQARYDK